MRPPARQWPRRRQEPRPRRSGWPAMRAGGRSSLGSLLRWILPAKTCEVVEQLAGIGFQEPTVDGLAARQDAHLHGLQLLLEPLAPLSQSVPGVFGGIRAGDGLVTLALKLGDAVDGFREVKNSNGEVRHRRQAR